MKEELMALTKMLGEKNEEKLKETIINMICRAVEKDLEEYQCQRYIISTEDIEDFINDCRGEAFDRVRKDIVNQFEAKIRDSISMKEN